MDPPTDDSCTALDVSRCATNCDTVFDGFSDDCGACLDEHTTAIKEFIGCLWGGDYDRGFEACADRCQGNDQVITATQVLAKCDAFCIADTTIGGPQGCMTQAEVACTADCRSRLTGLPNACAACLVGTSIRPRTSAIAGGICDPADWARVTDSVCAPYCQ